MSKQAWTALADELAKWQDAQRVAELWWRDDDVIEITPKLERLVELARRYAAPLTLAAIPGAVKPELAPWLAEFPSDGMAQLITVVQHGLHHRNHAPAGKKKIELGARPETQILAELKRGQKLLDRALERLPGGWYRALVPPWNRIDQAVSARLDELGYSLLSTYGPRSMESDCKILQVNCHFDPIDWRGTRGFAGESSVIQALVAHLRGKRLGEFDPLEPSGLLTHHLVHDEATWHFVESLLSLAQEHPSVQLISLTNSSGNTD